MPAMPRRHGVVFGLIAALGLIGGCERRRAAPVLGTTKDASLAGAVAKVDLDREQQRYDEERRPELVITALGLQPGARVADVGAGSGLMTVHLARAVAPGGTVVATDVDGAVLDLLAERVRRARLDTSVAIERRVVAPATPGLEDGQYDAVLLAEVDHYFDDPVAWLTAAAKALKPTGRIVITNRTYHRTQSLANAARAGLVLVTESTPIPSHFIAVFSVQSAK